jgi:kynurenine formamidase
MEFYDLSKTIGEITRGPLKEKITYTGHRMGGNLLGLSLIFAPGKPLRCILIDLFKYLIGVRRVTRKDFPEALGLSKEKVSLSSHSGTHLDSPYHFGLESENSPARTIDQIPLEWCYGEGVMLDFSGFAFRNIKVITKEHVMAELERIGAGLAPGMIVLIKTSPRPGEKQIGMSREATQYCVERAVKIIGIDTAGFDCPFEDMLENYLRDQDQRHLWPAHLYGREKEYIHIENLNLEGFTLQKAFKVCCFPIKILNASAGWTRVVAIKE